MPASRRTVATPTSSPAWNNTGASTKPSRLWQHDRGNGEYELLTSVFLGDIGKYSSDTSFKLAKDNDHFAPVPGEIRYTKIVRRLGRSLAIIQLTLDATVDDKAGLNQCQQNPLVARYALGDVMGIHRLLYIGYFLGRFYSISPEPTAKKGALFLDGYGGVLRHHHNRLVSLGFQWSSKGLLRAFSLFAVLHLSGVIVENVDKALFTMNTLRSAASTATDLEMNSHYWETWQQGAPGETELDTETVFAILRWSPMGEAKHYAQDLANLRQAVFTRARVHASKAAILDTGSDEVYKHDPSDPSSLERLENLFVDHIEAALRLINEVELSRPEDGWDSLPILDVAIEKLDKLIEGFRASEIRLIAQLFQKEAPVWRESRPPTETIDPLPSITRGDIGYKDRLLLKELDQELRQLPPVAVEDAYTEPFACQRINSHAAWDASDTTTGDIEHSYWYEPAKGIELSDGMPEERKERHNEAYWAREQAFQARTEELFEGVTQTLSPTTSGSICAKGQLSSHIIGRGKTPNLESLQFRRPLNKPTPPSKQVAFASTTKGASEGPAKLGHAPAALPTTASASHTAEPATAEEHTGTALKQDLEQVHPSAASPSVHSDTEPPSLPTQPRYTEDLDSDGEKYDSFWFPFEQPVPFKDPVATKEATTEQSKLGEPASQALVPTASSSDELDKKTIKEEVSDEFRRLGTNPYTSSWIRVPDTLAKPPSRAIAVLENVMSDGSCPVVANLFTLTHAAQPKTLVRGVHTSRLALISLDRLKSSAERSEFISQDI
ncbi:uncharacterized protein BDZ99DRAFT_475475 [Mytilinidion resinicola]|uniref:Uncharacterized protein n=1 Tax=Mytilinidion resinicola TaxID=574789 RepID=A0A6A6YVJ6_9PEZI|nr:uncharacterized protein BDZ99DRAFT_475475 [Mytilinidion resinicola]KAF2812005.1 hypothetical protein BDZ99DRAFT_475475 [Mytilinidion resinicola]